MQSRAVYDGGLQYDTEDNICEDLIHEWEKQELVEVRKPICAILRRMWSLND